MHVKKFFILVMIVELLVRVSCYGMNYEKKKARCLNPPRTAHRVETVFAECQNEVKMKLIHEAFEIIKGEMTSDDQLLPAAQVDLIEFSKSFASTPWSTLTSDFQHNTRRHKHVAYNKTQHQKIERIIRQVRRVDFATNELYHPTTVSLVDKHVAGCLLHCIYAKNKAVNKRGWPTLSGLINFYSEGTKEQAFLMAIVQSVNLCLRATTSKFKVDRSGTMRKSESCALAFDVFDCISYQITGYCLNQYRH